MEFPIPKDIHEMIIDCLVDNRDLEIKHHEWFKQHGMNTADWNALKYILEVTLQ